MNTLDKFHNWRRKLRWNKQYKQGRWDSLRNDKERVRYESIVDLMSKYSKADADILALGCGEGILLEHLKDNSYTSFVGMDFSSVSIKKAKQINIKNAEFVCADIHNYTPDGQFDVIVFNEIFYYIHESNKTEVLNRMLEHLKPGGIMLVSIYREGLGCWEYFEHKALIQLDFQTVKTSEELRYWKMGVFQKK